MSELGVNCSANCATKDHETWGACQRAKSVRVAYCASHKGQDATRQKQWDRELDAYRGAKAEGIQPDGTTMDKIEGAKRLSDEAGVGYDARRLGATPLAALR